jgi:hypothetical protein
MESYEMFTEAYFAVKRHVQAGDWFGDVDMFHIKNRKNRVESLHCFWPGMESSIGLSSSSTKLLNAFYGVWTDTGFFPEEFDQVNHVISRKNRDHFIYISSINHRCHGSMVVKYMEIHIILFDLNSSKVPIINTKPPVIDPGFKRVSDFSNR